MGDMFRSEKMALCQMFISTEAAYGTVSALGEIGCVQFCDLNEGLNPFQRRFVSNVRRCNELDRQIRYIDGEIRKDDIKMPEIIDDIPNAPNQREIIDLEARLEKTESEILEIAQNEVHLKTNFLELTEMCSVLEKTRIFFADQQSLDFDMRAGIVGADDIHQRGRLGFIIGAINREKSFAFERMLWRMSHGNIYLKRAELDEPLRDPKSGRDLYKTAFVIFYQGEQLLGRIKKVCVGFHAATYTCPGSAAEREDMLRGLRTRLEDLKVVLSQTEDHRRCVLVAVAKHLPNWAIMVTKMKAIYHTLNLFNMDVTNNCMIGEGWVPVKDLAQVRRVLSEGSSTVGSTVKSFLNEVDTGKQPPTYNRTNKFTAGFQTLIDAYGMASYREVNPALYTCITFPFLFAVMFGDLGHGFILLLFALWMVIDEKRLLRKKGGEIWKIFFGGRYIILLLGLYSMYTGFIYNDLFSKSINVFGSSWRVRYNRTTVLTNPSLQLDPKYSAMSVYPMGMDPIWQLADNNIIFLNTYKMKMSIIFAVLHMLFGVCMSVANFVYFKKYVLILMEFLPQILFLLLLFGYMCFMMFYKWVKYNPWTDYLPDKPGCAPSVLIYFINMMLFSGSPSPDGCDDYMFEVQQSLQQIFVIVAIVCIPWLLLGKPLYITCKRKYEAKHQLNHNITIESIGNAEAGHAGKQANHAELEEEEEEEEPMSEIWIHQAIHTIEYILSTISHTASYLRLWALSLAHAELSEVLWNMVLSQSLHFGGYTGSIGIFFIFAIWAFLTIAIMILMEGLSAFLHTLRLHWVEFMSKFYEGLGYAFAPFSFKNVLEADDED